MNHSLEEFEEIKQLIKTTIHEEVEASFVNRFKLTLKKLDSITEDINRNFSNLDEDRKDMAHVKTSQATVERLAKELLDMISNQTKRLTQTVGDKADEAIEASAKAVADKVEPEVTRLAKKISKGVSLVKGKYFWQFWKK